MYILVTYCVVYLLFLCNKSVWPCLVLTLQQRCLLFKHPNRWPHVELCVWLVIQNKCCLSLCLIYYRREWNTLGPLDSKLSLFSPTCLCRWSLLSHASVQCAISFKIVLLSALKLKKKKTHTHTHIPITQLIFLTPKYTIWNTLPNTFFSLWIL